MFEFCRPDTLEQTNEKRKPLIPQNIGPSMGING